jgi:choline kinase
VKTHVIILAQGTQQRMGTPFPKQLLPLAGCARESILGRTLRQLAAPRSPVRPGPAGARVTLVTWNDVAQSLFPGIRMNAVSCHFNAHPSMDMDVVTLPDPGNSSLKGIYRYLELIAGGQRFDRTVVLLGDVVYSWACLEAIFADLTQFVGWRSPAPVRFVGTSDISPSGGELWGVSWLAEADVTVTHALESALAKHPPYQDTYQPGQLRRWMWALHPSFQTTSRYTAIDDYTMDVDLPEHVSRLVPASDLACADDREHGVRWYSDAV